MGSVSRSGDWEEVKRVAERGEPGKKGGEGQLEVATFVNLVSRNLFAVVEGVLNCSVDKREEDLCSRTS